MGMTATPKLLMMQSRPKIQVEEGITEFFNLSFGSHFTFFVLTDAGAMLIVVLNFWGTDDVILDGAGYIQRFK